MRPNKITFRHVNGHWRATFHGPLAPLAKQLFGQSRALLTSLPADLDPAALLCSAFRALPNTRVVILPAIEQSGKPDEWRLAA